MNKFSTLCQYISSHNNIPDNREYSRSFSVYINYNEGLANFKFKEHFGKVISRSPSLEKKYN